MATAALLAVGLALVAQGVAAYNNGVGSTAAMGWNTWCTDDLCGLVDLCFESEIKSIADAMVAQGLDKLGYQYVNLDDCWSDTARDANGNLQPNPTQFPSGMKALADYVHSKGLKLGLYSDAGTETCKRKRPGAYGHYEQDAKQFAAWGIDFVKADNCHRVGPDQALYANYSAALNATGRPILFSLCNWGIEGVESWGPAVGQQYRFQMDHLPLWDYPPMAEGVGFGQGTKNIIEFRATLDPKASGPYGFMDPDFAETMMPLTMPFTESRTEWSFWCLWSAPLLIATDIRNLSSQPDKATIVTNPEPIAVDQDPWGDGSHRVFNRSDGAQLWVKPLANGDVAALLYNSADHAPVQVNATWDQLGWPASAQVRVRDLWLRQDVGVFGAEGFGATVKPRDVVFIRCTRVSDGNDDDSDSDDVDVKKGDDDGVADAWQSLGPTVGAWRKP